MKRKWKIIFGLTAALMILGFIIFENVKGLEADVIKVQPDEVYKSFSEEGNVRAGLERPIYSVFGGEILDVLVENGQKVAKGDVLIIIDSKELKFQLDQAEAQLKSALGEEAAAHFESHDVNVKGQELQTELAKKNLQAAENNFARIETLYQEGAITKQEYEEAVNILEAAKVNYSQQEYVLNYTYKTYAPSGGTSQIYRGRIEALEAQIGLLEHQIERTVITSPFDGIVADLSLKKGDLAVATIPLFKVFQDEFYSIDTFILAENIYGLEKDMKVELIRKVSGEENIFTGTITNIAPTAETQISALGLEEQRIKVTIRPDAGDGVVFFPGSRVDVKFITQRQEDVLIVPKTAVFSYNAGNALWVVEKGQAKIREIEIGFEGDREVVIKEGLESGDVVILNPRLEGIGEGKRISASY